MNETLKELCVDWWADRLEIEEKRDEFRAALLPLIHDNMVLKVDYDPKGILLEIIQSIGIECQGTMFSAEGILPQKTIMTIHNRVVKVAEGRRSPFTTLEISLPKKKLTKKDKIKVLLDEFRRGNSNERSIE